MTGGSFGGGSTAGGGLGSSGGTSGSFASTGSASQFLAGGLSSGGGSSFLTSGYAPGSLGQSALAGNKNATNSGDLFGRYYVNPNAIGFSTPGSSTSTYPTFGTAMYNSLYPGTNVATALGSNVTATTTSRTAGSMPGFQGTSTGVGGLSSFRTPAGYTTAIAFKYKPTTTDQLTADLRSVIARSTDLEANGKIQVSLDNGTVVLKGTVADPDQRRLAEKLLLLTPGVKNVRNELVLQESVAPKATP
jgi:hypothetical protein